MAEKLSNMIDDLTSEQLLIAFGSEMADRIIDRTQDGKDVRGRKFKAYSKKYFEAKRDGEFVRQASQFKPSSRKDVNLTLTTDMLNSLKVLVTPWEKGFTCGIVMDSKAKMSTEQYELCSTIARGMIKMATSDPHTTFLYGFRGFADDKKNNKGMPINSTAEFDDEDNVIDFIEYLKKKRDKELN